MTSKQESHSVAVRAILISLASALCTSGFPTPGHADDRGWRDEASEDVRILRGFEIAPVPLKLEGTDPALVGLGSYLVNAVASCNDCHSADPSVEYTATGNPYFKGNPAKVVNQSVYLGGGRNFGSLISGIPQMPPIVSRNLTPDKSGFPIGGRSFAEFVHIIRTGVDLDHLHPNCSATVTSDCFPSGQPFNGDLLQVMPWPILQGLSD